VARGCLNAVEGDFQDYFGFDETDATVREFLQGVGFEPFGQLGQFRVGQAGIGFADI
jgi:hypothetical protein